MAQQIVWTIISFLSAGGRRDIPVHLYLLVKVRFRPIWHGHRNAIPRRRRPSDTRFIVETINQLDHSQESVSLPSIGYEIPSIVSAYTGHAMCQIDPRTDQTRSSWHWEAHLSDDDEEGYNHTRTSGVTHEDD